MAVTDRGRNAVTHWEVLERFQGFPQKRIKLPVQRAGKREHLPAPRVPEPQLHRMEALPRGSGKRSPGAAGKSAEIREKKISKTS